MALLEGIPISPAGVAIEAKAQSVGLSIDSVTPQFVSALHHAHLKVFVYTVNDQRQIELARSLGVDAIISDFPERICP
jgi:glycerophosphoryl diester phosphodiesterase